MDGTLVNTEPYWIAAETALVEAHGGTWSEEEALKLVGQALEYSASVLRGKGVDLEPHEIIAHLTDRVIAQLAEFGPPWRPGAKELLIELREAGIPTALVTMSTRRMAEHVVGQLGFVGFDAIVSGDDVERGKPHPEAYLRGAQLLGVEASDCIAIEDSVPGITSAAASGAVTVGVPFMAEIPHSDAYTLWPSLDGRRVADLVALAGRAHEGNRA